MREIKPKELQQYLHATSTPPMLLDVREPWEYQTCHIAEAKLVPMSSVPTACIPWDKHQEIVCICHHGRRSAQVATYLEQQGFTNIINLSGGIDAWAREVEPSMPTY